MDTHVGTRAHWSFWAIGAIALLWNVLGCVNFIVQLDPDMVSAYRASERAIIEGRPLWASAGFAVAVFGGAIGSLLLLLRRRSAFYCFIASLLGVIVTMGHTLGIDIKFGTGEILGIVVMPLAVAAFLVGYTKFAASKGWTR